MCIKFSLSHVHKSRDEDEHKVQETFTEQHLFIFVGPGSMFVVTDCFGLSVTLPMGFEARVVLSSAHLLAFIFNLSDSNNHIN